MTLMVYYNDNFFFIPCFLSDNDGDDDVSNTEINTKIRSLSLCKPFSYQCWRRCIRGDTQNVLEAEGESCISLAMSNIGLNIMNN